VATVTFHSVFRKLTGDTTTTVAGTSTVADVLDALASRYGPAFGKKIVSPEGSLNRFVAIFVNNRDIRTLKGLSTPVGEHDSISLLPAVAGG